MCKYHNCNFNEGDIIVGINSHDNDTFLKIYKIAVIVFHEKYSLRYVDYLNCIYRDKYGDIKYVDIDINKINNDFVKLNVETY